MGLATLKEQNNIPVVVLKSDSIYHIFTGNDSIVVSTFPYFKELFNRYYAKYIIDARIKDSVRIILKYKDDYYHLYGDMDIESVDEKDYSYIEYRSRYLLDRNTVLYYNNHIEKSFRFAIIFYILSTVVMLILIIWMHKLLLKQQKCFLFNL